MKGEVKMTKRARVPYRATLLALAIALIPAAGAAAEEMPEPPCGDTSGEILKVEGEVQAPVKIHAEPPSYTEAARKAGTQGLVVVRTVIDENGDVVEVKLLKGQPYGLSAEAMASVARWRFEPATLDGEPICVYYNLTINFRLDGDHDKKSGHEG
jgi:TonB family protein